MATASKSGYRGMSPYMIGKNDRAGRLIPDEVRYAKFPDAPFWQLQVIDYKHLLMPKLGDGYNDWVEEAIPDDATNMEVVEIMKRKLRQIDTCQHEWVEQATGAIRLVAGEIDDNITTEIICKKCGAVMPETKGDDDDELPF